MAIDRIPQNPPHTHSPSEWTVKGKYVVVTGASDGIGKETAFQLFCRGATVGLVGRNPDKTHRVADEFFTRHLKLASSQRDPQVSMLGAIEPQPVRPDIFIADLAHCAEVKKTASEIKNRWPQIDVLINNVGGFFEKRHVTQDGFEQTFALNHLSYFLLTHHLLERLKLRPEARIINVASEAHRGVSLEWEDLQASQKYHGFKAYQRSKLANILFSNGLSRRLRGSPVGVNSLHPGFVASKFGHNNSGLGGSIFRMLQFFARTEARGAETSTYLAESATLSGLTGQYFVDCKAKTPSPVSLDYEMQDRLWKTTEELLKPWL